MRSESARRRSSTPALNFNGIGRFTYSIADGRGGIAGASMINNSGTPGNTVRFTPAANFAGITSFAYALSDANGR